MLSMTPTGWFQVAWSGEIGIGQVHRMHYFDRELVAWRAQSGRRTVMDATVNTSARTGPRRPRRG